VPSTLPAWAIYFKLTCNETGRLVIWLDWLDVALANEPQKPFAKFITTRFPSNGPPMTLADLKAVIRELADRPDPRAAQ
jgi:hypothetical protein